MAIYPDRVRGRITGKFVVEVNRGAKRLRRRAETFAEAKRVEDELIIRIESGEGHTKVDHRETVVPRTLLELLDRGGDAIWGSTSIHDSAIAAVKRADTIIGTRKLTDLHTTDIDRVVETLRTSGLAPATINRNLSALSRLLGWGAERGWAPKAQVSFAWQEEPEQTTRILHDGEDELLLAALRAMGTKASQVADFVDVLLATGLRRSELLSRQPTDLYTADGVTWISVTNTKTKRPRSVPLSPKAQAILEKRLPWTIYEHDIRLYFNRAKATLGLANDKRVVVHAMRHTFGTRLVRSGCDAFTTKELMGHASLATTQRYVHVSGAMKASAVEKLTRVFSSDSIVRADDVGGEAPQGEPKGEV